MNLPSFDLSMMGEREARFDLHLDPGHPALRGHFPGMPVLPGVVQIDWAMQAGASCVGLRCRAAEDFQVKFRRIVSPGRPLSLHLRFDPGRRLLIFEYWLEGQSASIGQVRLGEA